MSFNSIPKTTLRPSDCGPTFPDLQVPGGVNGGGFSDPMLSSARYQIMISALAWVPKGSANPFPKKPEADEEGDIEDLQPGEDQLPDSDEEDVSDVDQDVEQEEEKNKNNNNKKNNNNNSQKKKTTKDDPNDPMAKYNFDDYDEDEGGAADEEEHGLQFINRAMKGLMFYRDPDNDPHITEGQDEDIEDLEDVLIRPTDAILIAAIANDEDDFSHLDVMIYEEDCDNLYVHHDIILSSYPLCLAWMDQNPIAPQEKANFIAVGTFEPGIELWDLDVMDNLVPTAILGHVDKEKGIKNKKTKFTPGSHKDSVMALSWNSQQRNILASGSGDKTVKVWDICSQTCLNTFTHHKDKIQSVQWNPQEKTVMAIGSYDRTVSLVDVLTPKSIFRWTVKSDVENVTWNPHNPKQFIVGTEDGTLSCFDATLGTGSKPVWSVKAHTKAVSTFSYCTELGGKLFATGSEDNTLKLWKLEDNKPVVIEERNIGEPIFSISFFPSSPYLLAFKIISHLKNLKVPRKNQLLS
eukprot:gene3700-4609_t